MRIVDALVRGIPMIERQSAAVGRQFSKASGLRTAVWASAFTGQLVPQEATDELVLLERIRVGRVDASKKIIARKAARKGEQR
jgi:hypothetical protein